jgi:hypothetical protein
MHLRCPYVSSQASTATHAADLMAWTSIGTRKIQAAIIDEDAARK